MIIVKNVRTPGGEVINHEIPSTTDYEIDAKEKLLLLPGITDPHICFGSLESQKWNSAIRSAVKAGITAAIDVPIKSVLNNSETDLEQENKRISQRLSDLKIPLNYFHYMLCSSSTLQEIDRLGREKQSIKGVVICLENGEALDNHWENLFRLAAQEDVPIILDMTVGNPNRSAKERGRLLEKTIDYVEKWSNRLFVLNVATEKEIDLIQGAKNRELLVHAETTPASLFPEEVSEANHLWDAIDSGVIEILGTGYDIDKESSGQIFYNGNHFPIQHPSFFLPLLLTAVNEKKITLEKFIYLTSINIRDILEITKSPASVLVDLEKEQTIRKIYSDRAIDINLKGWPVYTIIQGQLFSC